MIADLDISWIGGNCPVQAEGYVGRNPFYFRARGMHWSFEVFAGKLDGAPIWSKRVKCTNEPFDAGWMTEPEARRIIEGCAIQYALDKAAQP
jgi:hypothetical protein